MKKFCLINIWLLGLFMAPATKAQKKVHEPAFRHGKENAVIFMRNYFYNKYGKDKFMDTICLQSITFVKFRLDKVGQISQVECSIGTFPPLAEALEETVRFTSGLWEPRKIGRKAVESRDFLLPIVYNIGLLCEKEEIKENFAEGFWRMHRFEGSPQFRYSELYKYSDQSLDCILLHPLYVEKLSPNICFPSPTREQVEKMRKGE